MFIKNGKLCVKNSPLKKSVENSPFAQTFTTSFHYLLTENSSLFLINLFHFSTASTTTTTKYIIIKERG
jgi:hypothetical protein